MPKVYHYEDDFFIVDGLARVVADAARLDPDDDIVGDTVVAAARLADGALRRIKDIVMENHRLVDRPESLRLLSRTAQALADALDSLAEPGSPLSRSVASCRDELARMALAHRAAASEMRDALRLQAGEDGSLEDHVSGDELSELLRNPEAGSPS